MSLAVAFACAAVISIDEMGRPQPMWIMNLVWPLTALFGGVLWLAAYWRWGRAPAMAGHHQGSSMAVAVFKGSSHCGAGCTLGDLVGEWAATAAPGLSLWFGWRSLFTERTFANWILDLLLAFGFGIGFQYFSIKPMRNLSVAGGLLAALKADIASIAAWQVGMYGAMAAIQFLWFKTAFGAPADTPTPEFWWAMQLAMLAGFATAYPVNWLLVSIKWKEKM